MVSFNIYMQIYILVFKNVMYNTLIIVENTWVFFLLVLVGLTN